VQWLVRIAHSYIAPRQQARIYVPTLVIAGAYDTWSFPEDREGLMRDLVHAPAKRSVLIPDATHFVLFAKNRPQFFEEVLKFLNEYRLFS